MSGSRCADAHHGQKSRWLQHRPDICLHPILITRSRFLLTRGRSPYRSAFMVIDVAHLRCHRRQCAGRPVSMNARVPRLVRQPGVVFSTRRQVQRKRSSGGAARGRLRSGARGLVKGDVYDEPELRSAQATNRQFSESHFISCWHLYEGETLRMWAE